jgi:hypothetical protein
MATRSIRKLLRRAEPLSLRGRPVLAAGTFYRLLVICSPSP